MSKFAPLAWTARPGQRQNPSIVRARDVLDILLVEMLQDLDYVRAADAAMRVFAARATHSFPLEFVMPPEWRPEVETLAKQPEAALR